MSASWLYIALGGGLVALCIGFFGLYCSAKNVRALKSQGNRSGYHAFQDNSVFSPLLVRWEISCNFSTFLLIFAFLVMLVALAHHPNLSA